ncbi:MAG: oligoendopeptidase F [Christensenellaceae bacterium]|nr:oligoendopeptidase F [Christensenellaceae bacterium]
MALLRSDVPENRKWNLDELFDNESDLELMCESIRSSLNAPELLKKKFNINDTLKILKLNSEIMRKLERVAVYAFLRRDEDTSDPKYQALSQKVEALEVEFSVATSFITPIISGFSKKELCKMRDDPAFADFTVYLSDIILLKKHILSRSEEQLLSLVQSFTSGYHHAFSMFDNADIEFGSIELSDGQKIELSHGVFSLLLQNRDREVRKKAFLKYYIPFVSHKNTLAAIYTGSVKKDCTMAKIREYDSALDCALTLRHIKPIVYENLLTSVKKNTDVLRQYNEYRRKSLGLKDLHMYDMYVPIVDETSLHLDYDSAYELVVKALKPLGTNYCDLLLKAKESGWIDVEETKNKRSGAYSSGCYDAHPVVLLNYQPTTHDVFTIAHEMGHAMHSYFSNNNVCYEKASYPIFLAEIASTVNEVLLIKYLLKDATANLKKNLLSYYLDMFRNTLFRQTMFAEFELFAHNEIESDRPLTADILTDKYNSLYEEYYSDSLVRDVELGYEWSRIPHFYSAFYVYQYATGLTAAVNIVNKILSDNTFASKYLKFLSSGDSYPPLETLKMADVDLTKQQPFIACMTEFRETLKKLKNINKQVLEK